MSTPLVSVCVVTFNHERYIRDCIMSAVAQSSDVSIEILVGDDLSEDRTSDIVESLSKQYPNLIRYFRHKERLGSGSKNYQYLISYAKGRFIAHLDGDDFWLPGKLALQVGFLEQHPDCPAVYSNALTIDEEGLPLGVFNNPQPTRFDINELVRRGNFLNHSSMLYRAPLKKKIIGMKAPFLDYRIHLAFAKHGAVGYLNQVFVAYRVASSSSIIVQANDRVRHSYWEALISIPKNAVKAENLAFGMAEFARSVIFRSIMIKDILFFRKWLPLVMAASPVGRMKMSVFIFIAVVRVGTQATLSAFSGLLGGNHLKIFYRR